MMTNWALIENNSVVNVILWDGISPFELPSGTQAVAVPAGVMVGIGYSYINGAFSAPAEPEGSSVLTPPAS
jgi:hypothetical protein